MFPASGLATLPRRAPRSRQRFRGLVLVTVLVAGFMDFLDAGIVILATPVIQSEFGASRALIEWIVAGYTLAFALGLITGGRLGDIFGHKRLFLLGVAGFTLASAACALAPSAETLVGARVLQGLTAALMVPQILSIIQVVFPPERRGGPLAAYGAMAGVANVSGPLVAGLLIDNNVGGLGWRSLFLINIPVGLAVFVIGVLAIHESRSTHPLRLDLVGALLVSSALLLVMFPLVEGQQLGWPSWTLVAMATAVPVFVAFGWFELRKERRDGSPLIPMRLFGNRAFVAGLLLHVTLFAGVSGFWLVFAIFGQVGLGFSTLQTGLTSLPWPIALVLVSGVGIILVPKLGHRVLLLGALLMIGGMAQLLWALGQNDGGITSWQLMPALAITGAGMALVAPSLMNLVLSGAPVRDVGAASGLLSTALQVGNALGVAIIGLVFFGALPDNARAEADRAMPQVRTELVAAGLPSGVAEQVATRFHTCFPARVTTMDATEPSGCAPDAGDLSTADAGRIDSVLQPVTVEALNRTFTRTFAEAVRYEIVVFTAGLALIFLLSRRTREDRSTPTPVA